MTDTEILDYLQNDYTMQRGTPRDLQFGHTIMTLGLKPGNLRELLVEAIERDRQRIVDEVTMRLVRSESPLSKTALNASLREVREQYERWTNAGKPNYWHIP